VPPGDRGKIGPRPTPRPYPRVSRASNQIASTSINTAIDPNSGNHITLPIPQYCAATPNTVGASNAPVNPNEKIPL